MSIYFQIKKPESMVARLRSRVGSFFREIKNIHPTAKLSLLLVFIFSLGFLGKIYLWHDPIENVFSEPIVEGESIERDDLSDTDYPSGYVYNPGPISMDRMKKQGCVADGILSGYGEDTTNEVAMINRSNCAYLHRALETWGTPPDFEKARGIMAQINKQGIIYGMFIAENINKKTDLFYPDENRYFDFGKMCRDGSDNVWGEHSCKPDLDSKEYRKYLSYITHEAMDLGIQSFLFGQIYYQDNSDLSKSKLPTVLEDMRAYAQSKGIQIAIGAQTGDNTNEKYLRQFDYIEGGVGIGDDGIIEDGPCWSHLQSCWALLWNEKYASKANNVFLHLDWSGLKFDDMSVFARMDESKRTEVLKNLHSYFVSKNMGFMMPMMATINKTNGGCYGPKKRFYSASNDYTCKDETVINSILGGQ